MNKQRRYQSRTAKTETFRARITKDDKALLDRISYELDVTNSEFMRMCIA